MRICLTFGEIQEARAKRITEVGNALEEKKELHFMKKEQ